MGLTTWKNAPDGRILKSDVTVGKNYLEEKQIKQLERAVTDYFDYIEDLIERENTFTMNQFATSINEFLEFRKYDILQRKGKISKSHADKKAMPEYDQFNKTQTIHSDFDKEVKKLLKKGGGVNGELDELINELCPNEVEVKTISEVCNISRGVVISKDYI